MSDPRAFVVLESLQKSAMHAVKDTRVLYIRVDMSIFDDLNSIVVLNCFIDASRKVAN